MRYSPKRKLPAQQLDWAQIWINHLIKSNQWSLVKSIPIGYYVYVYLDDE